MIAAYLPLQGASPHRTLGLCGVSTATQSRLPGPLRLIPLARSMPLFLSLSLMNPNRVVFGVNLGHLWQEVDELRLWTRRLLQGGGRKAWVRPHVDKTFLLAQAGEAQAYIEARRNVGKMVLRS